MAVPGAQKVLLVLAASFLTLLILLFAVAIAKKRSAELRTRDWIVRLLEQKFQSNVELADFHVRVFPEMTVSGEGLSLHYWATPEAPPLIRIEKFSFSFGLFGAFRAPRRIERIKLKRMVISIPPREQRKPAAPREAKNLDTTQVVVGTIEMEDMELLTLSQKPGVEPLDWEIHDRRHADQRQAQGRNRHLRRIRALGWRRSWFDTGFRDLRVRQRGSRSLSGYRRHSFFDRKLRGRTGPPRGER